jgi:UDPglucose--hexose-1-phosphate uridylyltransferase
MSELRQNLASKEWVVISPERSKKQDAIRPQRMTNPVPENEYESECPFCPGNEEAFAIIERARVEDGDGNWRLKVVDNKYKVLDSFNTCPLVPDAFEREGIYQKLEGCGSHELVIETEKHNKTIDDLTKEEIRNIVSAYVDRYNEFKHNPNNLITLIFKNYGLLAGQTQPHSHSQIVGSRVVPLYIRSLLHEAEKHFDNYGTCVFCDVLRYEMEQESRVVYYNDNYAAFVPFAAGSEHETWILPRWHTACLSDAVDERLEGLADVLQVLLSKFNLAIGNPDFNYVFRIGPYPLSQVPFYHWHVQVLPRTKIVGGFERATRIQVNTVLPEESAKMLRECEECEIKGL